VIFSKANLLASLVASRNTHDRGLHGLRVECDGGTVAGNGRVLMAVGPADPKIAQFPPNACDEVEPSSRGHVLPIALVERVLKAMTKSKRVQTQHVALSRVKDPGRIGFTSVDDAGDPSTNAAMPKVDPYPPWKKVIRGILGASLGNMRVCVNRKDALDLLKALESACPDKGGINPIFLEVSERGVLVRCQNFDTGQHAIGAIGVYNTRGKWLERDKWEEGILGTIDRPKRPLPPKKKRS